MANTTKNMQQIRHILQLRAKKVSIREIKNATGVSRPTIRIYLNRWDAMGLPWDHLASLDDEALAAILYQEPQSAMDRERLDDLQVRIPKMLKDLSKTGVTRQLLWQEYGCTFMATRVAKPRDKASVERHVQIVYQRLYAPLRNETFTSLRGLNSAIAERLAAHHALPFQQRREECRQSLFDSQERQTLLPLPATAFEVKHSANYKVQQNYHVQLGRDRHFYSVPHEHIGKHVQVIYTRNTVEIYDQHRRIAFHQRDRRINAYTTVAEHMPPNHQHHATIKGYSAPYFLERASRTGPACQAVARRILDAKIFNLDLLEIPPDPNNHISETPTQHQNLRGPEAFL